MIINHPFQFQSPKTVDQVIDILQNQSGAVLLAGGTDFIPLLKYGLKQPTQLVGLDQISALSQIEKRKEGLFIGAMNRLTTIVENSQINAHCAVLSDAARLVASPQIRNAGTIGGNICQDRRCIYFNQTQFWRQSIAPCFKTGGKVCHQKLHSNQCRAIYHSDLTPALIAVGAKVEYIDCRGKHEVSITTFVKEHIANNGGIETGMHLVCGFIIPRLTPASWMGFVKHSVRESIDFPIVNAAICYQPTTEKEGEPSLDIVVGAVAPEPIALIETQAMIKKQVKENNILKAVWAESALVEVQQKSQLIMDTGLALSARKKAFGVIGRLIEKLADYLNSSPIKN